MGFAAARSVPRGATHISGRVEEQRGWIQPGRRARVLASASCAALRRKRRRSAAQVSLQCALERRAHLEHRAIPSESTAASYSERRGHSRRSNFAAARHDGGFQLSVIKTPGTRVLYFLVKSLL